MRIGEEEHKILCSPHDANGSRFPWGSVYISSVLNALLAEELIAVQVIETRTHRQTTSEGRKYHYEFWICCKIRRFPHVHHFLVAPRNINTYCHLCHLHCAPFCRRFLKCCITFLCLIVLFAACFVKLTIFSYLDSIWSIGTCVFEFAVHRAFSPATEMGWISVGNHLRSWSKDMISKILVLLIISFQFRCLCQCVVRFLW